MHGCIGQIRRKARQGRSEALQSTLHGNSTEGYVTRRSYRDERYMQWICVNIATRCVMFGCFLP